MVSKYAYFTYNSRNYKPVFLTSFLKGSIQANGFKSRLGGGIRIVVGSSKKLVVKSITFWRALVTEKGPMAISDSFAI